MNERWFCQLLSRLSMVIRGIFKPKRENDFLRSPEIAKCRPSFHTLGLQPYYKTHNIRP